MMVRRSNRVHDRRGVIAIVVLCALSALVLGGFAFAEYCRLESQGLSRNLDAVRASNAAASGVEYVTQQLEARSLVGFTEPVKWTDSIGSEYSFSVYHGAPHRMSGMQLGPFDECGRLNLNSLDLDEEKLIESRNRLMALPGVTETIADSILDWIDADDRPRPFGAEADWYLRNGLPYTPRNGVVSDLAELLRIRGISSQLLFGDDLNGSGWIEVEERLASDQRRSVGRYESLPLCELLTVVSLESSLGSRGQKRIELNQENLVSLYRQLEGVFGRDAARFVVALRINGPMEMERREAFDALTEVEQRKATATARSRRQTEDSLRFSSFRSEIIDGFEVSGMPVHRVESLVDLLDRRVLARVDGKEVVLRSPWTSQSASVSQHLAAIREKVTELSSERQPGRINLNQAPLEVLMTIPGLEREMAVKIVRLRKRYRTGIAWLVDERVMTLRELQLIDEFLADEGRVFSGVVYGMYGGATTVAPISFLVDLSASSAVVLKRQRFPLSNIGKLGMLQQ